MKRGLISVKGLSMISSPVIITTGLLFLSPMLVEKASQESELYRHICACLRRHRAGDHGLVSETVRLQNRTALDCRGTVTSSFPFDLDGFTGDSERDTLWIKTLPGWEETFIMLPIDLDHQEELIMCESISD